MQLPISAIAGLVLVTPPLFHHNLGQGVPVGPDRGCWGQCTASIWPGNYFRSIPTYVITVSSQTDGETGGRTDDIL